MNTDASLQPPDEEAASVEGRAMRWLLSVGALLFLVVWALEWRSGLINPWDRWLLPLMAAVYGGLVVATWRQSAPSLAVRLVCVLVADAYIAASLLLAVFANPGAPAMYQVLTGMYWLPLAYGLAFVFLEPRAALLISLTALGVAFGPLFVLVINDRVGALGQEFHTLVWVIGVAQLAYIVLLLGVATMRAVYHRSQERVRVMRTLATTDPLTALPNRRAMNDALAAAIARAEASRRPLSAMLIDVDHFKQINDRHGHAAGDAALVALGQLLPAQMRTSDLVGRWGGEEFLVLCVDTPIHAALEVADRLRSSVATFEFAHGEPLTISVGLTHLLPGDSADTLLARADRMLYRAKEGGRDRIEVQSVALAGSPA